jgi:mono/diheme cytochrome c family protein
MRNSAMDNPSFMARTIGDWLNSWQTAPKEPLKSYAEVSRPTFSRGQYTFANHCAACHTIGRGDHIGPDLYGVTAVRERAWLSRFIVEPDKVVAEGDPIALSLRAKYKQVRMPNLDLNEQDAAALIDYIDEQSGTLPVTAGQAAQTTVAPASDMNLTPLIDAYLRMQQALHGDSVAGLGEYARAAAAAAATLGSRGESIRLATGAFHSAGDVKAARTAFGQLGDAIMRVAKEVNAPLSDDVEVAYCPMAQKYWLQKAATVQNPFYGQAMPQCGRITPGLPDLTK